MVLGGGAIGLAVLPRGLLDRPIVVERPEPGVRLSVAVRAEENAFRELGFGLVPVPEDAVGRDPEVLCCCIEVVEFE